MRCNVHLGGAGADYIENMRQREGEEYVEQLKKERLILIKADKQWYEQKIQAYEKILSDLREASENN